MGNSSYPESIVGEGKYYKKSAAVVQIKKKIPLKKI